MPVGAGKMIGGWQEPAQKIKRAGKNGHFWSGNRVVLLQKIWEKIFSLATLAKKEARVAIKVTENRDSEIRGIGTAPLENQNHSSGNLDGARDASSSERASHRSRTRRHDTRGQFPPVPPDFHEHREMNKDTVNHSPRHNKFPVA